MRRRDESGASLVEFTLVFPVFLIFIVGLLGLLYLGFVHVAAAQAAKEGARYASVWLGPEVDRYPNRAQIAAEINDRVPLFEVDASNIQLTYSCLRPPAQRTPPISSDDYVACPLDENGQPPRNARVQVIVTKELPQPFRPFARVFDLGTTIRADDAGITRTE